MLRTSFRPQLLPILGLWMVLTCSSSGLVVAQNPPLQATEQNVPVPSIDWGWEMLPVRQYAQRLTLDQFQVFYDFQYKDRRAASGIEFQNRSTPDSGKFYQPNHYDHGNGVAVADVDGDGLYDIYFVSQLGSNELWRNLGEGRFQNLTDEAGVGLADRLGVAASFADYDNDGDADLFVTTVRHGNVLFENDGSGRFRDVSTAAGVDYSGHSSGAVFFDYNGDGLLDLFVANVGVYTTDRRSNAGYWVGIGQDASGRTAFSGHLYSERTEFSLLYRNLGDGRFAESSEAAGLRDPGWSGDASIVDFNGDSRPDLYVLNMQGDDHYWQNVGSGRFEERTAEHFPKTPWGAMGIKTFDHNNDGLLDLLLTDMHSDMSRKVTPGYEKLKSLMTMAEEELQGGENNLFGNAFYENLGDLQFRERSDELGLENYWPWGVSIADINGDSWEDVLITSSMNFPYRYGINSLLLNNRGGGFLDSEFILGIEPRPARTEKPWYRPDEPWLETKKPWFELDCSGKDTRHPVCQGRSGLVTVLASVGTRSAVIFDLDGDGDLDIVTNEFNDQPQVFISNLSDVRPIRWLQVKLVGTKSNRDGLGAQVRVFAGGQTLTKFRDGKSGYLSQSSLPLYFGLGDADSVTKILVTWPTGETQQVRKGIVPNSLIEIVEQ